MTLLTNRNGGQVRVNGDAVELLKRAGWVEVDSSPAPSSEVDDKPKRTRRTTKK